MKPDFEKTLVALFKKDMCGNEQFCIEIWSAMANVRWVHVDGTEFAASFRYAGGVISDIIDSGTYMDWYCCGPYATVTDIIGQALAEAGWRYYVGDEY